MEKIYKGEDVSAFIENLKEYEKKIFFEETKENISKKESDNKELISYYNDLIIFNPFQYKPYLNLISEKNKRKCVYIGDEVGVGKTFETCIIISELIYSGEVDIQDNILIVCPNMLCIKWQEVLCTHFGLASKIIKDFREISGISIMSYNAVSKSTLESYNDTIKILIVDEAHNAAGGSRGKKLNTIREKSKYVVMLSATPLAGKQDDDTKQLDLLFGDGSITENIDSVNFFSTDGVNFSRTRKDEMREGTVTFEIKNLVVENKIVEEFIEKVCNKIYRKQNTIMKFAILNMLLSSPKTAKDYFNNELMNKSDEELKKLLLTSNYSQTEIEELGYDISSLDDIDDSDDLEYGSIDISAVRQSIEEITNMLNNENIVDDKLKKLKEVVKENRNKKLIIFTNYVKTAEYLQEKLNEDLQQDNVIVITGKNDSNEKWKNFREFENNESNKNILIITNVACEGQDMDFCDTIINYDITYNPVILAQRKGRIDRFEIKSEKKTIINFLTKNVDPTEDEIKAYVQYDNPLNYENSIFTVVLRKLKDINEKTGIYYNVVDSYGKSKVDINSSGARERVAQLFSEFLGKDGMLYNELVTDYDKLCVNRYDRINKYLAEYNLKISGEGSSYNIEVDKNNIDFLKYALDGGTIISHILNNITGE